MVWKLAAAAIVGGFAWFAAPVAAMGPVAVPPTGYGTLSPRVDVHKRSYRHTHCYRHRHHPGGKLHRHCKRHGGRGGGGGITIIIGL
jgi:hypothetical protein